MTVLLLSRDLAVISQVDGAAARVGVAVRAVSSESDAVAVCTSEEVELVLVDLGIGELDLGTLVGRVKGARPVAPRVVAFGSHVHVEKLAAARDAGCDAVMSRGQFFSRLDAVLRG